MSIAGDDVEHAVARWGSRRRHAPTAAGSPSTCTTTPMTWRRPPSPCDHSSSSRHESTARRGYVHPMRVTITGAAGRIGRHLTPGLAALGHEVRGIDRVSPDESWAGDVVVADIGTDDDALAMVLSGADAVVHLAANSGESDFAEAIDSHPRLTHRVLDGARHAGIERVVYASSNHAVGFTPRGRWCRSTRASGPTRSTDSGRRPPRPCAACTTIATGWRSCACASARSANGRSRAASSVPGSRWAMGSASSTRACGRPPSTSPSCTASPRTRGGGGTSTRPALGYEPLDDAERWADEIEAIPPTEDDELDDRYLGGWLARPG